MEKIYTVSFFGHRFIDNITELEKQVERVVETITLVHRSTVFLVGQEGDFDRVTTSVVRRAKALRDNIYLSLVLPYPKTDYIHNIESYNEFYDDVEIYDKSEIAHPKAAYQIRNRYMVDRSDVVIFCVKNENGGAAQTLRYAMKQNKQTINLA